MQENGTTGIVVIVFMRSRAETRRSRAKGTRTRIMTRVRDMGAVMTGRETERVQGWSLGERPGST